MGKAIAAEMLRRGCIVRVRDADRVCSARNIFKFPLLVGIRVARNASEALIWQQWSLHPVRLYIIEVTSTPQTHLCLVLHHAAVRCAIHTLTHTSSLIQSCNTDNAQKCTVASTATVSDRLSSELLLGTQN